MRLPEAHRVSGSSAKAMRDAIGNPMTAVVLLEQEMRREARKELRRERYERRYARHSSKPQKRRPHPEPKLVLPPGLALGGFARFMKQVSARLFGNPVGRVENRGQWPNATKAGPGRRRALGKAHPAGSKLVKRFVRDARGENVHYRKLHQQMTGKETP